MQYRTLGQSGLKVSPLCLGTMMFGGPTDEATARRIIDAAADQGVNFIDTANVYEGGRSEEIVGRGVAARRRHWVLATKLANPAGPGPNDHGLSRRHAMDAVDDSLRRLGTSEIDILYLHKEDHATPLAETVHAMADLIRAGKLRHFGVSNFRAWARGGDLPGLCDAAGIDRPGGQPALLQRHEPHAGGGAPAGLRRPSAWGCVPYSPLARGVLTGKYRPDAQPDRDSRAGRQDKRIMETEFRPESLRIAQVLAEHAAARGVTPGQFAVAWVLNNALITGVIAGPRTEAQWADYVGALDYRFTAEDEALVDSLVPAGHPSTPGYNDPAYPLEGRAPRPAPA